ncbi:hypothetical protein [Mucilaginibacter sp. KACC 22063]|uniref:hypothetical protein n=1 Tax=Mucilaginibacter sp. KACC 22063 TaxID=3025666 RepID=UPI0023658731|nr:hypothetical protein [Mucilaginibacter sp. KACC 22063]WDF54409.1 hypothetical protein PQ461_15810 [Mucilaginibacter sp. KACC 22063]
MPILHQPYYVIDFKGVACKFDILINDMPAYSYDDTGTLTSQVPINQLILHSGTQSLSYVMRPMAGTHHLSENSSLEIKVAVAEVLNLRQSTVIAEFKPVKIETQTPMLELKQQFSFKAEVPYQLMGWSAGMALNHDPAIRSDLNQAYARIRQILLNKDYAAFRKLYEVKLSEVDKAIYSNAKESEDDWQEMIDYISQPGMEVKFDDKSAQMHFYGGGKVVTLIKPNHEPALYFENVKEKEEYQLPFLFYRKAPGLPLTVIR